LVLTTQTARAAAKVIHFILDFSSKKRFFGISE
jgi:hypothetical protein